MTCEKGTIRSSENLELRTSNRRPSHSSRPSRLSQGSAIAAAALMNNAGQVFISKGIWPGAAGGLLDTHFPALVR